MQEQEQEQEQRCEIIPSEQDEHHFCLLQKEQFHSSSRKSLSVSPLRNFHISAAQIH